MDINKYYEENIAGKVVPRYGYRRRVAILNIVAREGITGKVMFDQSREMSEGVNHTAISRHSRQRM